MTALNTKFNDLAYSLVNEYGKDVQVSVSSHDYNPKTGWASGPDTPTIVRVSPPYKNTRQLIGGDLSSGSSDDIGQAAQGDMTVLMPAKGLSDGFAPEIGMKMVIDNEQWNLVGVSKIYGGPDIVAYEIIIRK